MLTPEALRLVTVEVLRPTASLETGDYPTIARGKVFDSRAVAIQDLDDGEGYTPVISVYGSNANVKSRGDAAALDDVEHEAVLDIIVELAVLAGDDAGQYADAVAGTDPAGRLVLSALCSKIRYLLERSPSGALWRKLAKRVASVEMIPFAIPDLGIRFHRMTLRYVVELTADAFVIGSGGLPEPMASVHRALPSGSYAKQKLDELAGYFSAEEPPILHGLSADIKFTSRPSPDA